MSYVNIFATFNFFPIYYSIENLCVLHTCHQTLLDESHRPLNPLRLDVRVIKSGTVLKITIEVT